MNQQTVEPHYEYFDKPNDSDVPPNGAPPNGSGPAPRKGPGGNSGRPQQLKLETNVPHTVSLVFPDPKGPYESQFPGKDGQPAPKRYLYTVDTPDGRQQLYLQSPDVAKIEKLNLTVGEVFLIGKYKTPAMRSAQLEVERIEAKRPEPVPASPLKPVGTAPAADQRSDRPQPTTSPAKPRTRVAAAMCTAIEAWQTAQLYAKQINFSMPPVSAEDIRTVAITLVINDARNGGRQ